jgi:hypothetical protein
VSTATGIRTAPATGLRAPVPPKPEAGKSPSRAMAAVRSSSTGAGGPVFTRRRQSKPPASALGLALTELLEDVSRPSVRELLMPDSSSCWTDE